LIKTRLVASQQKIVNTKRNVYISLVSKLDAMSPLKVLTRGYAMVSAEDGNLLRSVKQVQLKDKAIITLTDGKLIATIDEILEERL
jgi:exodeoxyribonuclease VII large subunit